MIISRILIYTTKLLYLKKNNFDILQYLQFKFFHTHQLN